MRAVWSFWSRPQAAQTARQWCTPLHHWLAWGLSLAAARRHYPDTVLVTDTPGKKFLVDTLGLEFAEVVTELDRIAAADPQWWALGKLIAYSLQDQPFVHIDTDAFLWKPLPAHVAEAHVFAQCPEFHGYSDRSSLEIDNAFALADLPLPVEWEWGASRQDAYLREENCGIVGGCRVDFLRHYGRTASELILDPRNAPAWARLTHKSNMAVEQFFLAACVDFHRNHPDSPFRGVHVKYLFSSWEEAFDPNCSTRVAFTHLLGDYKRSPAVGRRIEERVKRDDPGFFRRCERAANLQTV
jgi:hypothetical protein